MHHGIDDYGLEDMNEDISTAWEKELVIHDMPSLMTPTITLIKSSRRSRIFLKRGPLSREVPSRRDSMGGGG